MEGIGLSERAIVGTCYGELDTGKCHIIGECMLIVRHEHFKGRELSHIWKAMCDIYSAEGGIDRPILLEVLVHRDVFKSSLDAQVFLADVSGEWTPPINLERHCRAVYEAWLHRAYEGQLQARLEEAKSSNKKAADLIAGTSQALLGLDTLNASSVVRIGDDLESTIESWGTRIGHPTGHHELDEVVGGFTGGDYFIIAARASMGKTALMCELAWNLSVVHKIPSMVFSLEMARRRITTRMIAVGSKVSAVYLWRNLPREKSLNDRVRKSTHDLEDAPLYVDDTSGIHLSELVYKVRQHKIQYGVQVVFVDYLQLITYDGSAGNREQEVTGISRGLKNMAKDLDICVVPLSQLSRETDKRSGNRPRLSDLRESGSLEQDADIVAFIHRPEYYGVEYDDAHGDLEGKAFIIVDKNRNGSTGEVELHWDQELGLFGPKKGS